MKKKHHYDGFGSFNDQGEMPQASEPAKAKSKITSRVREQAAIFCSAMACYMANGAGNHDDYDPSCDGVWSSDIVKLGHDIRYSLDECHGYGAIAWAESEALLRTGWEP